MSYQVTATLREILAMRNFVKSFIDIQLYFRFKFKYPSLLEVGLRPNGT